MELYQKVLVAILALIILYVILGYIFPNKTNLSSMSEAMKLQTVEASNLSSNNNTVNYTYSTWIYIEDWNYKFGDKKIILSRLDGDKNPSPSIELGSLENDLLVSIHCYSKQKDVPVKIHKCKVNNIPLQKWVNIIISVYGRTLDVYIDGKLVRTCLLPGVPKTSHSSPVLITPNGGFSGWTSNFQYWPNSTNPQEAYDIYKSGYGGSSLGNFFNKYGLKLAFMEDNAEKGSIQL